MNVMDILKQYAERPTDTETDFDEVARQVSPDVLGSGIAQAFRSDQTPSFGDMIGSLLGGSNPQQRHGLVEPADSGRRACRAVGRRRWRAGSPSARLADQRRNVATYVDASRSGATDAATVARDCGRGAKERSDCARQGGQLLRAASRACQNAGWRCVGNRSGANGDSNETMRSGSSRPHSANRRQVLLSLATLGAAQLALPFEASAQSGSMLTRPIPSSGEALPVIGLGSWITFNVGNDRVARDNCTEVMRNFLRRRRQGD